MRFVGYSGQHKGYKCLDVSTGHIYISRDVVFDESVFPFAKLHPNAGALLRSQILLLPPSLRNSEFGSVSEVVANVPKSTDDLSKHAGIQNSSPSMDSALDSYFLPQLVQATRDSEAAADPPLALAPSVLVSAPTFPAALVPAPSGAESSAARLPAARSPTPSTPGCVAPYDLGSPRLPLDIGAPALESPLLGHVAELVSPIPWQASPLSGGPRVDPAASILAPVRGSSCDSWFGFADTVIACSNVGFRHACCTS